MLARYKEPIALSTVIVGKLFRPAGIVLLGLLLPQKSRSRAMASSNKPTRKTRRSPRGHQSRESILDVAERHFADNGYRKASIASIAEEVGMSDPGLLHHFGSKAGLLTSLLEQRFAVDKVKMHEDEELGFSELFELIQRITEENTRRRIGVRLLMVILAESFAEDHPARSYFQERYRHVREILTQHLQQAQDRGDIAPDCRPGDVATGLIAMLDGLQMQWLLDDSIDMPAVTQSMLELLQTGLRKTD